MRVTRFVCAASFIVTAAVITSPSMAVIAYDQNVTSNAIFGGGNINGSYTTDRANGVELGLRGKLRHNAVGAPENTFNSNGDGTYTFLPGVAVTQSSPTTTWSFEWSINTDYQGTTGKKIVDYTYELKMTSTYAAAITPFDPIHDGNPNPNIFGWAYWDHSMGDNNTAQGQGVEAACDLNSQPTSEANYFNLISSTNLAQNSWKPSWFATNLV